MANFCNVDGAIVPESGAVVPVLDRGFLFGDSVYEVIRTRQGNLFGWRQHLDRLRDSATQIGLRLSIDDATVMRNGQVVESGETKRVLVDPSHEYTRTLIDASRLSNLRE